MTSADHDGWAAKAHVGGSDDTTPIMRRLCHPMLMIKVGTIRRQRSDGLFVDPDEQVRVYRHFAKVVASERYQTSRRLYHYSRVPQKALKYPIGRTPIRTMASEAGCYRYLLVPTLPALAAEIRRVLAQRSLHAA